jgi:hypothetical protein
MKRLLILLFHALAFAKEAYFLHKTVIIPKDDKRHRKGEDDAEGSEKLLVVADGVGGWIKRSGVDAGIFTRHLVEGM